MGIQEFSEQDAAKAAKAYMKENNVVFPKHEGFDYEKRSKAGGVASGPLASNKFKDGGRAEEIKTLVEGGHDVEFMMNVEPYIKNDMLAQYGSEIKEPMMDPKAKPKDMFSTVNIRLGNQRGLAGMYAGDLTNIIKQGDEIIAELSEEDLKKPFIRSFLRRQKKRKTQTPYERAEEVFRLDKGELKDKPQSFMPAKDTSFVSLRQSDDIVGQDEILDSTGNPRLTKPANTALVFIHEARHKAVQDLNLEPVINRYLDHIPDAAGGAEEVLMRFMDYKNAITPEQKENSKKWVINFYDMLNYAAKSIDSSLKFTDPFQDTKKGKQEFEKLDKISNIVNTMAKEKLKELRGVPVYEDKDYPLQESFMEKVNKKGIFRTMFPQNVRDK